MEVQKIENVDREFLANLKVRQTRIFSDLELDFLMKDSICLVYEFKQELETESNEEFYEHFSAWLHEDPHRGYVYYYIIAGMKKDENLTSDEFKFLERNVTECFDTGYGWITQTNHERRFKRRIKLIMFEKNNGFRKLIPLKLS